MTFSKRIQLLVCFCLLTIACMGQEPTFEWGFGLGTNGGEIVRRLATDVQGNIYAVGNFGGNLDFDPGPNTMVLSCSGQTDAFIMKLNPAGNLIWAKSVGGTAADQGMGVAVDSLGNVFFSGIFSGSVDLDPGPATYTVSSGGGVDGFILKLNATGDLVWAHSLGSSTFDLVIKDLAVDGLDVVAVGQFQGNVDFDPGAGTYYLGPGPSGFLLKWDSWGNFLWANEHVVDVKEVEVDAAGAIYTGGDFTGNVDFDFGIGTYFLNSGQYGKGFVQKSSPQGAFLWAIKIGDASGTQVESIALDADANIVVAGGVSGPSDDFDPGPGTIPIQTYDQADIFGARFDSSGMIQWAFSIGGNSDDFPTGVATDPFGNCYFSGSIFANVDLDPGVGTYAVDAVDGSLYVQKINPNGLFVWGKNFGDVTPIGQRVFVAVDDSFNVVLGGDFYQNEDYDPGLDTFLLNNWFAQDLFVVKWGQDSCTVVTMFVDSMANLDCQNSVGFISVVTLGGTPPYSYLWNTTPVSYDTFITPTLDGVYSVQMTDAQMCQQSRSFLVDAPSTVNGFDLQTNLVATVFIAGRPSTIWLDAFNDGCIPVSGTVSLVLDSFVTYLNASPLPTTISGDTLTWSFASLVFGNGHLLIRVNLHTSSSLTLSDTLCFTTLINPIVGDGNPADNLRDGYCFPAHAAFDPNDKQAYPIGACQEHYVLKSDVLTYTVRFQNTGNAEALNVFVRDTLDASLDISTLRIVGSSHPVYAEIHSQNEVRFVFHDIHLPDSTSDEIGSHGYLVYEIVPSSQTPTGTIVSNTAAIYFDFNAPVVTNTVFHTLVDVEPACAVAVNSEQTGPDLLIFPNPASNEAVVASSDVLLSLSLFDAQGVCVYSAEIDRQHQWKIDLQKLPQGIYMAVALTENGRKVGKVLKY